MVDSVEAARDLIESGRVRVDGAIATKATRQVAPGETVFVVPPPARFVSRAGDKLDAALDRFGVEPKGRHALDVGSSTGGFTDCLLAHGVVHVCAIDVGTNQLHERLRRDSRVEVRERTDVRCLHRTDVHPATDLVTVDCSFISLIRVAPSVVALAGDGGDLVVLVKPQFEVPRIEADRGSGVITDPTLWRRSVIRVMDAFEGLGAGIMEVMHSTTPGSSGNNEFFILARAGARGRSRPDRASALDAAIATVP